MISYEKHPERSYTQKRQILKELRNTILASLARDGVDALTAFSLVHHIQAEVVDAYVDFEGQKGRFEHSPQVKKEYQETYDAVTLGLSKDRVDPGMAYLVLQSVMLDVVHDLVHPGESATGD